MSFGAHRVSLQSCHEGCSELSCFRANFSDRMNKIYVIFIYPDYPRARPTHHGLIATSLLPRSTMTMCSRQGRTRAGLLILSENGNSYTIQLIQHIIFNIRNFSISWVDYILRLFTGFRRKPESRHLTLNYITHMYIQQEKHPVSFL